MRITLLQGAFLPVPPLRGGAVEKMWFRLGQEFAARGHKVTHVSRWCDGLPEREEIGGVEHRRVRGYDQPAGGLAIKWRDGRYSRRAVQAAPAMRGNGASAAVLIAGLMKAMPNEQMPTGPITLRNDGS